MSEKTSTIAKHASAEEADVEKTPRLREGFSKTRKSAKTRATILATASDLIAQKGSTDFQMAELSERCGISKGALYYYFPDRDAIVGEVFADEVSRFERRLVAATEEAKNAHDALQALCREFASCLKDGGPLALALASDLGGLAPSVGSDIEGWVERFTALIRGQILRAQVEGTIRAEVNPGLAAAGICGMFIVGSLTLVHTPQQAGVGAGDGAHKPAADVETTVRELFDYAVRGIAVPGATDGAADVS